MHRGKPGVLIKSEIKKAMKKTKAGINPRVFREITRRLDRHEKQLASLAKIIDRIRKRRILINEKK